MTRTAAADDRNDWVDAARLVAALAVVVIHCAPRTGAAEVVGAFALSFAVPFFLLTSLFYAVGDVRRGSPDVFLRRWPRLWKPYIAWSLIYLALRIVNGWTSGAQGVAGNWRTAVDVALLGGAAVHLYFLPLLMLGLLMVTSGRSAIRGFPGRPVIGVLCGLGMIVAAGILPPLLQGWPWATLESWARMLAVYTPMAIGFATLQAKARYRAGSAGYGVVLIALWLIWGGLVAGGIAPWHWLWEGGVLAALLLGGVLCLADVPFPRWLRRALPLSFGIYLSHHAVLEGFEFMGRRVFGMTCSYSLDGMLAVCICVFTLCAGGVLVLRRHPFTKTWIAGG